jgi:hypothetical protein
MNRRKFLLCSSLAVIGSPLFSRKINFNKIYFDDYEIKKCKEKLASLDLAYKEKPIDSVIDYVGESFIGTPYEAGTLDDNSSTEELVIKVTGLDCVTFVENTLVMSRLIKRGDASFDAYKKELEFIRYRNGKLNGYASRLHYFTDWIYDNHSKGIVNNITEEIGGVPYNKEINFMTIHSTSYKQLMKDEGETFSLIKNIEKEISERNLFYIPKKNVNKYYELLKTGDIIATTTDISGLDVTHTGYIYKENDIAYFMHASVSKKEVTITDISLKEYLMGNKKQTGIIVSRPQEL